MRLKFPLLGLAVMVTLTPSVLISLPTNAQTPDLGQYGVDNPVLQRAMNLARQAAERANGGLTQYRAEPAMSGIATQSPFVANSDGSFTFTFLGGKPAEPYSIESIVTVSADGQQVNLDYNGPIKTPRPQTTTSNSSNAPVTIGDEIRNLQRAMNLARQAGINANGGLSIYRPDMSMFSLDRAKYVVNENGTATFTFLGGRPGAAPSIESVVTVAFDGSQITIDYNGPIRDTNLVNTPS